MRQAQQVVGAQVRDLEAEPPYVPERGGAAVRAIFGGFGVELRAAEHGRVAEVPGNERALRATPPVGRAGRGGAEVPVPAAYAEDGTLYGWARTNEGEVLYDQGSLEAAADVFEAVVPLWREVGARPGLAQALTDYAGATVARGDVQRAKALLKEALRLWKKDREPLGEAWALYTQGRAAHAGADTDTARAFFEESLVLRVQHGDRRGEADAREALALLKTGHGPSEEAMNHLPVAGSLREAAEVPVPPNRRNEVERLASMLRVDPVPRRLCKR